MPSHELMVAAVETYVAAFAHEDAEEIVRLYAPDATVEDPVGTPVRRGHEAIRTFYEGSMATAAKLFLEGPVRTAGRTAAFPFSVHLTWDGAPCRIDVIDLFVFNDDGKITQMRAFWGPENIRRLSS